MWDEWYGSTKVLSRHGDYSNKRWDVYFHKTQGFFFKRNVKCFIVSAFVPTCCKREAYEGRGLMQLRIQVSWNLFSDSHKVLLCCKPDAFWIHITKSFSLLSCKTVVDIHPRDYELHNQIWLNYRWHTCWIALVICQLYRWCKKHFQFWF